MGSQYKSLLGLNELAVDSLDIANLDLTNTNITGLNTDRVPEDENPLNLYYTDLRFDTRLSTKSTTDVKEGKNLYYTEQRVRDNDEVKASTQHRSNTSNPHQTSLYNLIDTNISAPTIGQYLTYNDVDGKWRNTTIGSIDTLADVVITAPIANNSYLTYNSINWVNKTFPINVDEFGNISMGGNLNITGVNLLNTKDVDTWISEHEDNNDKVSADGSINTHSDVLITGTPADNQLLIYSTGQWRNTNSPFIRLDGTATMTGGLNMGGFNITNVGNVDGIDVSTLDTSVVKLTGDQTIAGNKIFTAYLGIKDSNISNTGRLFFNYNNNIGSIYSAEPDGATGYPLTIVGSSILFAPTTGGGITLTGNVFNFNNTTAISGLPAPFYDGDASTKLYTDTKLAKDGTTAMTGGLNMGGFNITNVNLVDGIDVSTLDTSVVKLTGNQTIAGTKSFSNVINANAGVSTTTLTASGKITAGGAKILLHDVFNQGGNNTGIFFSSLTDYNWGMYMVTSGASKSFSGGTAVAGNNFSTEAIRFRVANSSTQGFIWENHSEQLLMSLRGNDGTMWVRGLITASAGVSTTTLTASGLITANAGIDMKSQSITNVNLVDGVDVSVLDTSAVKLTGDQTIAGNKKFTSVIEVSGSANPATFDGIGIAFDTGTGMIAAQKTATATWYPIQITGSYVELYSGDNVIITATGTTLSLNNNKITNLATPTLSTDGANKSYVDTNCLTLTGDQTITGIKTFNGTSTVIKYLTLTNTADFNNQTITNAGNITYNGARILNQDGGDIFFSQTAGDYQYFLFTLNTDTSGTADQRGYVFTNVAYDVVKGAGLYISKLLDNKSASSDIVRFNNAGGMRFYGALDMNSNNITSAGTITSTAGITTTTLTASGLLTANGGSSIVIQGNVNGCNTRGIFLWDTGNTNYGIYMASNGGGVNTRSLAGGSAVAGNDFTSFAVRFRVSNVSTDGFIWENSSEQLLMSLNGANGTLWTKGLITASAGISTTTLTTSDNIVVGAGKKIFIDRSANANNKLVLYDNGTNSTTAFLGFGIGSAILLYNVSPSCSHVFYVNGSTELFRINETAITASKTLISTTGNGAKISIQGITDGGTSRGIFMWDAANSDWGIYMSQSGGSKTISGGTAPAGGVGGGITSYAIRFRAGNASTNGFIWENNSNTALMSLRGSDGQLWVLSNPIQYSDRRKKEDIKECLGLDFINKLNPVCYRMIDDTEKKQRTGLIAQELEDILTEMDMLDFGGFIKETIMVPCPMQRKECEMKGVCSNPEDVKCVDSGDVGYGIGYSEFIAPLIKAVQQLSEKVVNLEKENKNLMNILQDQAKQLAEIRAVVFSNVPQ